MRGFFFASMTEQSCLKTTERIAVRTKPQKNLPVLLVLLAAILCLVTNLADTILVNHDWKAYWGLNALIIVITVFLLTVLPKDVRTERTDPIK